MMPEDSVKTVETENESTMNNITEPKGAKLFSAMLCCYTAFDFDDPALLGRQQNKCICINQRAWYVVYDRIPCHIALRHAKPWTIPFTAWIFPLIRLALVTLPAKKRRRTSIAKLVSQISSDLCCVNYWFLQLMTAIFRCLLLHVCSCKATVEV